MSAVAMFTSKVVPQSQSLSFPQLAVTSPWPWIQVAVLYFGPSYFVHFFVFLYLFVLSITLISTAGSHQPLAMNTSCSFVFWTVIFCAFFCIFVLICIVDHFYFHSWQSPALGPEYKLQFEYFFNSPSCFVPCVSLSLFHFFRTKIHDKSYGET